MGSTAPVERQLASTHVDRAAARLRSVAPTVVAITGSYGKTSTKGYVAHLVGGTYTDRLRRTDAGWLIAERKAEFTWSDKPIRRPD